MKLTSLFPGKVDPALYPPKITSTEFRNEDSRFREPLEGMGLYTGYEAPIQLVATRNRFSNTYTLRSHYQTSTGGSTIRFKDARKNIMEEAGRDDVIAFMLKYEEECRKAYLGMWASSAMNNAHEALDRIYSYNTDDHVKKLVADLTRIGTGPLATQTGADKTMAGRMFRLRKHTHSR